MKLLIFAQIIDQKSPELGFFHNWVREFSKHYESVTVICLLKGGYDLPKNVKVLSLGKEDGESRIKYIKNFFKYIWREKKNYDKVFVHMNQEYVLLGGFLWKIWGKDVYMWRNHHAGSFLTDIAAFFCKNVFCTSRFSFTAKYKKTIIMPIGVEIENFRETRNFHREKNSLLFLARISPTKRPDLFVDAINDLAKKHPQIIGNVYGDAIPKYEAYYESIKSKAGANVKFYPGVNREGASVAFQSNNIFVNLSSSGMYDKTIFEAMISGCLVLASNENLRGQISDDFIFQEGNMEELTQKIEKLLRYNDAERVEAVIKLKAFATKHSLPILAGEIFKKIQ